MTEIYHSLLLFWRMYVSFLCVLSLAIQNHRSINLTLGTNVCVSQVFFVPSIPWCHWSCSTSCSKQSARPDRMAQRLFVQQISETAEATATRRDGARSALSLLLRSSAASAKPLRSDFPWRMIIIIIHWCSWFIFIHYDCSYYCINIKIISMWLFVSGIIAVF